MLRSRILVVGLVVFGAACLDPILGATVPTHPLDAGAGDGGAADAAGFGECLPAEPGGDGHHNPGQDCLSCHAVGNTNAAPEMLIGGTLYDNAMGSNGIGGKIEIIDATGKHLVLNAADGMGEGKGNFYTLTKQITFPIRVRASKCPDSHEMISPVASGQGSCNSASCHGSTMRVFLP